MGSYSIGHQFWKPLMVDDSKDITDIIEEVTRVVGYDLLLVNDFKEVNDACWEFEPGLLFLAFDLGLDDGMDNSEKGREVFVDSNLVTVFSWTVAPDEGNT